jgi:hypothetical protein
MRWLVFLTLLAGLAVSACNSGGSNTDDDRFRGFYGGFSTGMDGP